MNCPQNTQNHGLGAAAVQNCAVAVQPRVDSTLGGASRSNRAGKRAGGRVAVTPAVVQVVVCPTCGAKLPRLLFPGEVWCRCGARIPAKAVVR
jgi:ribosomal protein L40E